MPRGPRTSRGQKGVALIEALVAVLIFSFGVLGLIGLEATAIDYSIDAEDRTRATELANDLASDMWLNNLNGTVTSSVAALNTTCTDSTKPVYLPSCVVATPVLVSGTTNTWTITITWVPVTDKTGTAHTFTTQVSLT